MATLRRADGNHHVALESEHTIGRSPDCRLSILAPYVSTHHALIQWSGAGWVIRDLGSTNGTRVNDNALPSGEPRVLAGGDTLVFGHPDERWRLDCHAPPRSLLVPLDGGEPVPVDAAFCGLPSSDNPVATLYRDPLGAWKLERGDGQVGELQPGGIFELEGQRYRFSPVEVRARTITPGQRRQLDRLRLMFAVTRNEEHVEITLDDGQVRPLPPRAHDYTLLTLARRRIADAERGHPPTACGWMERDEVVRALSISPAQLNLEIFRIRQQFAELGVIESTQIVQRRSTTHELRIGAQHLEVRNI